MTAVGKILVFFNLVFSLVVGAFAVMDYTARTHWAVKYDELNRQYLASEASRLTYKTEADRLARERDVLNKRLTEDGGAELKVAGAGDAEMARVSTAVVKLLRDRREQVDRLTRDLEKAKKEANEAERNNLKSAAATLSAQEDVKRRQADNEKLREVLKSEVDRNNQLVRDMNEMRDRAVAAEISARSLKDINQRLEEQLQDLARDLTRIRSTGGPGATGGTGVARRVNPPPDNVEGLIRQVDRNLVTLTIGSDAGLAKGQTLEVFRYSPTPRYVGRIRIVDVTAHQAVGRADGRMSTPMQVGDTVASSILGNR